MRFKPKSKSLANINFDMSRYGTEPVELLLDNEDMLCDEGGVLLYVDMVDMCRLDKVKKSKKEKSKFKIK